MRDGVRNLWQSDRPTAGSRQQPNGEIYLGVRILLQPVPKRNRLSRRFTPINRALLIVMSSERGKRRFSTFSTNFGSISANGFQQFATSGIAAGQWPCFGCNRTHVLTNAQVDGTISSKGKGSAPPDERTSHGVPPPSAHRRRAISTTFDLLVLLKTPVVLGCSKPAAKVRQVYSSVSSTSAVSSASTSASGSASTSGSGSSTSPTCTVTTAPISR